MSHNFCAERRRWFKDKLGHGYLWARNQFGCDGPAQRERGGIIAPTTVTRAVPMAGLARACGNLADQHGSFGHPATGTPRSAQVARPSQPPGGTEEVNARTSPGFGTATDWRIPPGVGAGGVGVGGPPRQPGGPAKPAVAGALSSFGSSPVRESTALPDPLSARTVGRGGL